MGLFTTQNFNFHQCTHFLAISFSHYMFYDSSSVRECACVIMYEVFIGCRTEIDLSKQNQCMEFLSMTYPSHYIICSGLIQLLVKPWLGRVVTAVASDAARSTTFSTLKCCHCTFQQNYKILVSSSVNQRPSKRIFGCSVFKIQRSNCPHINFSGYIGCKQCLHSNTIVI